MLETEPVQLMAIGIIFIFAIKEFFGYLRNKKNGRFNNYKDLDNKLDKIINLLIEIRTRLLK